MPRVKKDGNKFIIEPTYEEERTEMLKKIREARDLGETDEVARLQEKWKLKKGRNHEE